MKFNSSAKVANECFSIAAIKPTNLENIGKSLNDTLRDRVSAADSLESSICDPRFHRHFGPNLMQFKHVYFAKTNHK